MQNIYRSEEQEFFNCYIDREGWTPLKKLLIYLKDYKKESVIAPLFKMLEAVLELFVPIVMANVIDVGIANSDRPYVIKMCLVMILLGILGLACSITARHIFIT